MNNFVGKKWIVIVGLVLIVPGLLFLGLGLWQYFEARSFVENSVTTDGKVMRMDTLSGNDGVMFAPVFEYTDENGNRYLKASDTGNYPAKYRVGVTVKVLYQPDDPIDSKIDSDFSVWGIATILLIVGGLFVFFGLVGSILLLLLVRFIVTRATNKTLML